MWTSRQRKFEAAAGVEFLTEAIKKIYMPDLRDYALDNLNTLLNQTGTYRA